MPDAREQGEERLDRQPGNERVALSHDWLTGMRGGERVLELLCERFPAAPVYTLLHNPSAISSTINRHVVHTSLLRHVPGIMTHYRYLLPFFPAAMRSFRTPRADLIISTSHCVAKALRKAPGARHLCYCFTPMRYAWGFFDEYFGNYPLKKALLGPLLAALRRWDRACADEVDRFVAISRHIRERIARCYGRRADLVYPPVDTGFYTPGSSPPAKTYDLVVSALVPYKRIDLAVAAATHSGFPLKIVGVGTETAALQKMAGPHVEFLGWQSNATIRDLYRNCRCLLFPGEEDFGIVPVEVQACGRPVVAYAKGGALETVRDGVTGVFFANQTAQDLGAAVEACAGRTWHAATLRAQAEQFSTARFLDGLAASMRAVLEQGKGSARAF